MKITLKKIFRHFATITKHRHMVIRHSKKAGILWQGLLHDLSKYSPSEFWVGARYFSGDRSPNEAERHIYGYSTAWLHHKGRNKHHYEYWIDLEAGRNKHHFEYWSDYDTTTHELKPVKMPEKYIAEMFCDRVAASKIYQGKNYTNNHPIEYFMRAKGIRPIHPETSDIIEDLLRTLAEHGEDTAFSKIRKMLNK